MFTGIISAASPLIACTPTPGGLTVTVAMPPGFAARPGDSIAVNGVCSTVIATDPGLVFEYMPETLSCTTIPGWRTGDIVNLEQSLRLSDRLDGHILQGHVDGIGAIAAREPEGNAVVFTIQLPDAGRLVAAKGSIALDGISLTVTLVASGRCTVKMIPYTMERTNMGRKAIGDQVNIEYDVLAKYIERLLHAA